MRSILIVLLMFFAGAPAQAAPAPAPQLPPHLSDPAMAEKLGRAAGVLTDSLMDLPVGELEAAIEGRPPTAADRARRVRDSVDDPYLGQRVAAEAAQAGRTMQAATKALISSLPAVMSALGQMEEQLERVVSNLPDPTYPRR